VIADNAEDAGTPIVLLTNNPESPLALRADIVLRAVSRDAMFSEGIRFSQNSLNYVVELLYLFLITGWEDTVERTKLLNKKVGEDRQL
jgi:DNA-binding MurR/RpiR family transcriptional regulator